MKINVTEHPMHEPTITIDNHPRPLTRAEFIKRWTDHADELKYLSIDITAETALKANEKFNAVHMRQRIDAIEAKACMLHVHDDYRDMIHDELHTDPTRTDDEIAHLVAMRYAHP